MISLLFLVVISLKINWLRNFVLLKSVDLNSFKHFFIGASIGASSG